MKIWQRMVFGLSAVILFVGLVGCGSNQVTGNGKSSTKARVVPAFNTIKISGAYKIKITQGNAEMVKITTDFNVIPLVVTEVKENKLRIHNKKGVSFRLTQPVYIQIVVRNLKEITASGANQLMVSNIKTDRLDVSTNGSVQANFSGQVGKFDIKIAGSGNIKAKDLLAKNVKVRMMGSGEIIVHVMDQLDTKITGNGTVRYLGNPDRVEQSIIGSGTLEHFK